MWLSLLLNIRFHNVSNDIVVAYDMLIAAFICGLLIRYLYYISDFGREYQSVEVTLAVYGFRLLRTLGVLLVLLSALLGFRVPIQSYRYGDFFTLNAVTSNWWCIIRIFLGCTNAMTAYLFDSHPGFRIWNIVTLPVVALLDLFSQVSFASDIWCMESGVCVWDSIHRSTLYLYAWRDLVSACIALMAVLTSIWLTGICGLVKNEIYMPRKEHRELAQRMDKIRFGPQKIDRTRHNNARVYY